MNGSYHHNTFGFHPRSYEKHLSPLGKQILDNLIQLRTEDRNKSTDNSSSNVFPRMDPPPAPTPRWRQTKKDLSFLDKEPLLSASLVAPPPQLISLLHCKQMTNENNDDKPFNFNDFEEHTLSLVSKFNQRTKIVETTNDVINPVNEKSRLLNNLYNSHDDDKSKCPRETLNKHYLAETRAKNISWNEMFDTELLPTVTTNALHMIKQAENRQENTMLFPGHTKAEVKQKDCEQSEKSSKKVKRKNQAKTINAIPKKVRKVRETNVAEISLRKQKYTKTVKDWLDNVDPNNLVEEDKFITKNGDAAESRDNKLEMVIEKVQDKHRKKVVQALLANKNGKMKFGIATDRVDSKIKVVSNAYDCNIEKAKESNMTEKYQIDKTKDKKKSQNDNVDQSKKIRNTSENDAVAKPKEKKTKSKFVAPIISQVTVKDVHYEVVSADSCNKSNTIENLRYIEKKDVLILLIYCNGFSQLNYHHSESEDTREPEGLLVYAEEVFYYLKGGHQSFKEVLTSLLDNNKVICYEGKNLLMHLTSNFELEFNNLNIVDVKIGTSLLDPDNLPENFSDVQKALCFVPQYTIATDCVLQKTAWYATLLKDSEARLTSLLKENNLWSVFVDIEMKLLPVIAEMERRGVSVDLQKLKSMEDALLLRMREVEQMCYQAAGKSFQIMSASQVRVILYDELRLDARCNVKIKATVVQGAKSTSETMLRSLVSEHPLPKWILEYRHLHKAHATFLTGIAQQVKDGIVRPTWVQMAAATGRIASNNPNLQAIPKTPFSLQLSPDDTNHSESDSVNFRCVYTSRAGHSLVAADFQHVECRVFAHLAADAELLAALHTPTDLFRALAAKWLNKSVSEVSPEDRERTKRIVYASLYGAGCKALMDMLHLSYDQTLSVISSFNRTFPSLKAFGRSVVTLCSSRGGLLQTACGRARRFPHIASLDHKLRAQAERQAVNFLVQGSAADLCKTAMVCLGRRLRGRGHLLLQIHDELVWEVRDEHLTTTAATIKEVMESCGQLCGMSVPLPVSVCVGRNWGEMRPLPVQTQDATH